MNTLTTTCAAPRHSHCVTFVTIDPKTGRVLGTASAAQRQAYLAQPTPHGLASFRKAVRVGDVLVDEHIGGFHANDEQCLYWTAD